MAELMLTVITAGLNDCDDGSHGFNGDDDYGGVE